jgi:hypothetical protein
LPQDFDKLETLLSKRHSCLSAARNYTRDQAWSFGFGNQVLISSHRKLLRSKAVVVSAAETPGPESGRHGAGERKRTAAEVSKAD